MRLTLPCAVGLLVAAAAATDPAPPTPVVASSVRAESNGGPIEFALVERVESSTDVTVELAVTPRVVTGVIDVVVEMPTGGAVTSLSRTWLDADRSEPQPLRVRFALPPTRSDANGVLGVVRLRGSFLRPGGEREHVESVAHVTLREGRLPSDARAVISGRGPSLDVPRIEHDSEAGR